MVQNGVFKAAEEGEAPTHVMVNGLPVPIEESKRKQVDQEEVQVCKLSLRNISKEETKRRMALSKHGMWASLVLGAGLLAAGDRAPREARLAMILPLAQWIGFYLSSVQGICGMSVSAVWDPDGAGIRKIADPEFARAIWNKALKTHVAQAIIPTALTLAFYKMPV